MDINSRKFARNGAVGASRLDQLKDLMDEIERSEVIFTVNSVHLNLLLLREVSNFFVAHLVNSCCCVSLCRSIRVAVFF